MSPPSVTICELHAMWVTAVCELWAYSWWSRRLYTSFPDVCGLLSGESENSESKFTRLFHLPRLLPSTGWFTAVRDLKTVMNRRSSVFPQFFCSSAVFSVLCASPNLWHTRDISLRLDICHPWVNKQNGVWSEWEPSWPTGHKDCTTQQWILECKKQKTSKVNTSLNLKTDPWLAWSSAYIQHQTEQ
jgi:hypothetical protein